MSPAEWLLVKVAAILLPLCLLAGLARIYPGRGLVYALVAPLILSGVAIFVPEAWYVVLVVDAVILGVALADLLLLPRRSAFSAERELNRAASLGRPHEVTITLNNRSRRAHDVSLRDDVAAEIDVEPAEFHVRLAGRSRARLQYEMKARRRGAFTLERVYLRVTSRFRMWQRQIDVPVASTLHVYPDMQQLGQYAVLARSNRLNLLGLRRTRRIGQDNEFERLRDYTVDDNFKHIDWRTTARRGKLTVKDFQANQSQRIVFLVDCGRMMTNEAAGLSFLDHAFNAMLMLSYVALTRGDNVGLICFSDDVHTFVPPKSGLDQMNRLLHASFDRFPHLVESRYDKAFVYLKTRSPKRSLVILITNVIDEVNATQIEQYLSNLAGPHLPLGVLLRDRRLFEVADQPHENSLRLFEAAAAADVLIWRRQVLTDLSSRGVLMLDLFPEELTAPLVNQYLDIKARHLL